MVGPCAPARELNQRVPAACSLSLCGVAYVPVVLVIGWREAAVPRSELIRIGYVHPDRLLSYPDLRYLSGCWLPIRIRVGGSGRCALVSHSALRGAVKRVVPRPRRFEATNDDDFLKCDALNVSEPTGVPATARGRPCRRVVPWAYLHVITDCIAPSGIRRNLSETCRG